MQLYYCKKNNFGDALNPWFFEKVLPGFFDEDGNALFSGIGTLLNHHMPSAATLMFFSGCGGRAARRPPPTRIKSALKRRLAKVSAGRGPKLHPVDYPNASKQLFDSQVERLRGAAQLDFVLSKSQTLADRQDRLETLLHALRERRAKAVG